MRGTHSVVSFTYPVYCYQHPINRIVSASSRPPRSLAGYFLSDVLSMKTCTVLKMKTGKLNPDTHRPRSSTPGAKIRQMIQSDTKSTRAWRRDFSVKTLNCEVGLVFFKGFPHWHIYSLSTLKHSQTDFLRQSIFTQPW